MRLERATFMTFIMLSTSLDGQVQRPNPQHSTPSRSEEEASQPITQNRSPLAKVSMPVAAASDRAYAPVANPGLRSLHETVRTHTLITSQPSALVAEARLRGSELPEAPQPQSGSQGAVAQLPSPSDGGSVSGVVLDTSGAVIVGAEVTLAKADGSQRRSVKSGADGSFAFIGLPSSSYLVSVVAQGFGAFTSDRLMLAPQQSYEMPKIMMSIATASTEVTVRPTDVVAAEQLRAEERQRVFGVIPSYFTSYIYDAAPLTAKQKFSLTARDTLDPVSFIGVGIRAAIEQQSDTFPGYGGGAGGYGKRYAAALGDSLTSDFLGHAVFPSLLHQDPRYFYQGSGSAKSRLVHAISFAVFLRNDSGHLKPNYSYLLGDLGSGALSNLYYPHADRGAGLVFTNAAIGIAGRAAGSVFREFVSKRITSNVPGNGKP